ncbi:SdpI family protein [Lederbergia wuyishanensis]|uniref:Membrane protein n=1 Tax=Lederbergia wuyishanensis TaxID=1347903 RepID=A0ABU0D6B2_9BACI|nr:SdpI family protein [Lederbergia wuyishanensis]MCJ8008661.1 SdpI family protein [Lederbergia wuyishanensis]MDQ0343920.1 putative membrane protein [Lederbergia wuyishanensis]
MKRHWFGLIILVIIVFITCISYPFLPEQIGMHWNYKGVPDDFADKSYAAFVFPGITLGVYILGLLLPKIDPRKNNYPRFEGTYFWIINGIILFLFLFQIANIASSLGIINPKYVVPVLIGLLFIFIGNLSPKFKPNYFIGIRTPWTLANEDVWRKTHRFGGKVFVVLGILMLLVPVIPAAIQVYYVLISIFVLLGLIVFSSYYFFVKI